MGQYEHRIYDLLGCGSAILSSAEFGLSVLAEAAAKAGTTVVQSVSTSFPNGGYSCAVLLKESHMSLHTWPEQEYCAADVFLCTGDHEHVAEVLISLSGATQVRRQTILRGSRPQTDEWVSSRNEDGYYEVYRALRHYYTGRSAYQDISIFEHPKHGKILMIDGDIQLATADEALYHELLVHPAVLAHRHPRTAVVIGGGDGGALREVLKHETIESVVLVDIDSAVIDAVKCWMPEVPGAAFRDPRVEVRIADAAEWRPDEKCDVLIVDLTAPRGVSVAAYKRLARSIFDLVQDDGVVSIHSGWWRSGRFSDLPGDIANVFASSLIHNVWLDSFRCFWSFVVCWNGACDTTEAFRRIAHRARAVSLTSLNMEEYLATVLRRGRDWCGARNE